jgi:iron complex outermembrane receptor protein
VVQSTFRQWPAVEELGQELRVRGGEGREIEWLLGVTGFRSRDTARTLIGFGAGDLAPFERLTALLPATPGLAGPLSFANRALVHDPAHQYTEFLRTDSERRTLAVFGAADWRLRENLRLRLETRVTRERLEVDSRTANFAPSFRRAIDALHFNDVTPRVGLDLRVTPRWLLYASAAKGTRSGGVNAVPGLIADEQRFAPESNWTYELGARVARGDALWASATLFWIDWTDTQITGLSNTPGVTALITRNTASIATGGIELALDARVAPTLRLQGAFAWSDARYRAGSEDPGSGVFCGISGGNTRSTFCNVGPTRFPGAAGAVAVPYIDGNVTQRAPRLQWQLALAWNPAPPRGTWRPFARADLSYQSDVFDRSINGARFGERTLLDLRAGLEHGAWSVEAWARNVGDERYVRAMASRLPQFYPVTPRPNDLILGERRRLGIDLRYRR